MSEDGWPYTKRFHEDDKPNTLNGAWFLPRFNYWSVECFVPDWSDKTKGTQWKHHKTYKFAYERGENPEDYVHRSFNKSNIHLGDGVYVNDRTSQYYKLCNYSFIESEKQYDELDVERLSA
jgi:hypothetical protein